jgi:hypothetical protein
MEMSLEADEGIARTGPLLDGFDFDLIGVLSLVQPDKYFRASHKVGTMYHRS